MAVQYGHDLDLLGRFQLLRALAQNLASDPSGLGVAQAGQFWFNTTTGRMKFWTGTGIIDPTDLANSSGNLPPSRITGFDTQVRTSRLDQMAAPTAPVGFNGQRATGAADGTANSDFVTLAQLLQVRDMAASAAVGVAYKTSARAVATSNITLSGLQTIDGVALAADDRVLVAGQNAPEQNGIYLARSAAWVRATDADQTGELAPGTQLTVTSGTTPARDGGNADSIWRLVSDAAVTIGTTAQVWEKLPGATAPTFVGGAGLTLTGSTFDVGQGDGIVVDSDAVRVNPQRVTRKRSGIVPTATSTVTCDDGTTMSVTVTGSTVQFAHQLASRVAELHLEYWTSPGSGNTQGQRLIPEATNDSAGNSTTAVLPAAPGNNQLAFSIRA